MNEQISKTELSLIVIPEYENARMSSKDNVISKIGECIINAPVLNQEESQNLNPRELIKHSLIIKYPEDSELIPVIQDQLYQYLFKFNSKLRLRNSKVSDYTLMGLDKKTSLLKQEVDEGEIIEGETYFEHEIGHAQEAIKRGHGSVYIVFPIAWIKNNDDEMTLKLIHASSKIRNDLPAEDAIEVALAPRYPSEGDFLLARQFLKSINVSHEDRLRTLRKEREMLTSYPRHNGKRITAELAQKILLPLWKQLEH
jgi:hypothetical protein